MSAELSVSLSAASDKYITDELKGGSTNVAESEIQHLPGTVTSLSVTILQRFSPLLPQGPDR